MTHYPDFLSFIKFVTEPMKLIYNHFIPKLNVNILTNMVEQPGYLLKKDILKDKPTNVKLVTGIKISNIGSKPTTIEMISMVYYKNWTSLIFNKKPSHQFLITPETLHPLPYCLEIGKLWVGIFNETEQYQEMIKNEDLLIAQIHHSIDTKPFEKLIISNAKNNALLTIRKFMALSIILIIFACVIVVYYTI